MYPEPAGAGVKILARAHMPSAQLDVVEIEHACAVDYVMREEEGYRLELSLTPRFPNTEISFPQRWPEDRFKKAGRLFLKTPDQDLRIRSDPGGSDLLRIVICQCHHLLFRDLIGEDFEPSDRLLETAPDLNNSVIDRLMLELAAEASRPGFARDIIMEGLAAQIAGHLVREFVRPDAVHAIGGLSPWRLRLIDERVAEIETPPTLSELATLCRMSVRQLSRGFRMSRGLSLGRHVAERRLEIAKEMLARGRSVKAVAYALGFASPSSFGYAFRRYTGFAPKSFKN